MIGHGSLVAAEPYLRDSLGIGVAPWSTDRAESIALGIVALGGLLAGVVPAVLAYRREPVSDLTLV